MENLKLYTVTKPSSDGTFVTGDIIWLSDANSGSSDHAFR